MEMKHETRHIVAIMDLLGATKLISGCESEDVMNFISDMYEKTATDWVNVEHAPEELKQIKCVTFSDNIALGLELPLDLSDKELNDKIDAFVLYICILQCCSLKNPRLLFRGGIAIGDLYMDSDKNFVWGKALLEAHILEEKVAIYPRVVLSRMIDTTRLITKEVIAKDFDGEYFVDYFKKTKSKNPEWIQKTKDLIATMYMNEKDERVLQKYQWLEYYIAK